MFSMTVYRSFFLMFAFLGLWGCASGHQRPFPPEQPAVRQPESVTARLRSAVESSPALTMKIIGRDFAAFNSQEAEIVRAHLQRNQCNLIIDLHEDPAACGFYMYQYGRLDKSILTPIIAAVAAMGYSIEQDVKMVTLRTRNGIIDAPMWGLGYMKLSRQLSLSNYGRIYNSTNVFTIETPTTLDWEDRLRMQYRALDMLFNAMLKTGPS